jgi:hypothetical protein
MLEAEGVRLTVVECAFGERPFEVTRPDDPRHVQLRSRHELWMKECLINIGISRLPSDWRYAAWIDADVQFARADWARETIQQLQHHPVVQLFAEAVDLGPDGLPLSRFRSFGWSHVHGVPRKEGAGYYGGVPAYDYDPRIAYYHHPGFAWAMRRETFDALGGLVDWAVVGEADYIMARAFVGEVDKALYPGISHGYRELCREWQRRALEVVRRDVGYVPGLLLHGWHVKKSSRNYWNRCKILVDSGFDPSRHLKRDSQGLYQLVDRGDERSLLLRDGIRAYFRSRNEDCLDI